MESLDALSFNETDFAYRLQTIEDDLVDAYVKGELTGKNLDSFNSHYLSTPMRIDKVKFATAFQLTINRSDTGEAKQGVRGQATVRSKIGNRTSSLRSIQALYAFLNPPVLWGGGLAAMLVLILGTWVVVDNFRLRNRLEYLQAEIPALNTNEQELRARLEHQTSANTDISEELDRTRSQIKRLEQQRVSLPKPVLSRDPAIAHFDLYPQMRGINRATTISIPPGTDFVSFQLELEPGEVHSYRAELKTQSGNQVIWRSGKLNSRSRGNSRVTNLSIPARMLMTRWYILELSSISSRAATEVEAGYPFKVEKK